MVWTLHGTHQEPVTSASADRSLCWYCRHTLMRYAVAPADQAEPTVARQVFFACGWPSAIDFSARPLLLGLLTAVPACWLNIRGSQWELSHWPFSLVNEGFQAESAKQTKAKLYNGRCNIILSICQFDQMHRDMKMVDLCFSLMFFWVQDKKPEDVSLGVWEIMMGLVQYFHFTVRNAHQNLPEPKVSSTHCFFCGCGCNL